MRFSIAPGRQVTRLKRYVKAVKARNDRSGSCTEVVRPQQSPSSWSDAPNEDMPSSRC